MSFEQIISGLKSKNYYPFYFLMGEEAFFIDEISDYVEKNVLSDSGKDFNQTVFYGRDVDVNTIIATAKRYPMMSDYQVVIVKEAQMVNSIEDLEPYFINPLKSTILVVCYKYKKIDKRKSFAKLISKNGVLFESVKLYENQVSNWIVARVKEIGLSITPKAAVLLQEFVGTDLSNINNELEKIRINLPEGSAITDRVIEENIGISKDYNVFELQKALGERNILKANQIINYFAANKKDNPMIKVVAILYSYFNKLLLLYQIRDRSENNIASQIMVSTYFVKDYLKAEKNYTIAQLVNVINLLREYDLKSKGVGSNAVSEGELMKEMIYRILH